MNKDREGIIVFGGFNQPYKSNTSRNLLMPNQEENAQPNKEEDKENAVESLLDYECEDDDDGTDWET